eukprot:211821-Chlamydomonas_euryale.AAC.1
MAGGRSRLDRLPLGSREPKYCYWPGHSAQSIATHVLGFLGMCQMGLNFIPWGMHGRAYALWWVARMPGPCRLLSFKATASQSVRSSCVLACSVVRFKIARSLWQEV